jgi:hypothetical protein
MTKRFLSLALLALISAPTAFALTLTLQGNNSVSGGYNGYGPYQTGVGGEFTFAISDASLVNSYYAGRTRNLVSAPSFQTFCVEGGENIDASHPVYTANYNTHSVYSNVQLTKGAAYLYSQFAQGILSGYNFTGAATAREASAALLQQAIWHYMGGQESQGTFNASNPFEVAAAAHFVGGEAVANSAAIFGADNLSVYVLNLWDSNGKAAQDQLIYTTGAVPNFNPVPDGGTTAMLLGLAFTGTAFFSRRIRRHL